MISARIVAGDCRERMAELEPSSIDAIVTDPPYGLEFMGKGWDKLGATAEPFRESLGDDGKVDYHGKGNAPFGGGGNRVRYGASAKSMQAWHEAWATSAYRVLKPGGHLIAFGGTRTYHRMVCAIEDAGFEIRDCLAWLYGSGFPKSLDVSRAIDKAAGVEREVVGPRVTGDGHIQNRQKSANDFGTFAIAQDGVDMETAPATADAKRWQGWGTALKPAFEPIVLARKPLAERTVAANVLAHGTGALNVDGCRIGTGAGWSYPNGAGGHRFKFDEAPNTSEPKAASAGRWPANVMLDEDAAAMLDDQSNESVSAGGSRGAGGQHGRLHPIAAQPDVQPGYGDSGGASRFFYTAKAARSERNERTRPAGLDNDHPTVKPIALMRWLVRLVTPPGGLVLDPFAGSGTTLVAALMEGFSSIGFEITPEYVPIAQARIDGVQVGLL